MLLLCVTLCVIAACDWLVQMHVTQTLNMSLCHSVDRCLLMAVSGNMIYFTPSLKERSRTGTDS